MNAKHSISDREREIMKILWDHGAATAADIQQALSGVRQLKDSTIRTVLTRLEEKGYVTHKVDGRTFVFSCREAPGSVAAQAVKQILDRFCHGSLETLLVGMVEDELVDADELQKIADRLGRARREGKSVNEFS